MSTSSLMSSSDRFSLPFSAMSRSRKDRLFASASPQGQSRDIRSVITCNLRMQQRDNPSNRRNEKRLEFEIKTSFVKSWAIFTQSSCSFCQPNSHLTMRIRVGIGTEMWAMRNWNQFTAQKRSTDAAASMHSLWGEWALRLPGIMGIFFLHIDHDLLPWHIPDQDDAASRDLCP